MYPMFQTTATYPMLPQYQQPNFMGGGQQLQMMQQQQPQQSSGILGVTEVQGYQGAMDTQVPAGQTALLFDSNEPLFYLKAVNTQGIATIKRFKFQPYEQAQENMDTFVTREEFNQWKAQHESVSQPIQQQSTDPATAASSVQHSGSPELRPGDESSASTATSAGHIEQW